MCHGVGAKSAAKHPPMNMIPPTPQTPATHDITRGGNPADMQDPTAATEPPVNTPAADMQVWKATGPEAAYDIKIIRISTEVIFILDSLF